MEEQKLIKNSDITHTIPAVRISKSKPAAGITSCKHVQEPVQGSMFLDPGVYGGFGTIVFGWFIFLPYEAEVKKNLRVHLYGEALDVQHHQRQVLLCLSS